MYTFIVDKMDNILSLRISEERLATLSNGGKIPQEMMEFLILNRSFLIGLGAVLLGASAFLFNKKNYIRGR
jgi:hypothetical protein